MMAQPAVVSKVGGEGFDPLGWGKPVLEPDLETVRLELDPDSLEMGLELLLFLLACLRQGGSACGACLGKLLVTA